MSQGSGVCRWWSLSPLESIPCCRWGETAACQDIDSCHNWIRENIIGTIPEHGLISTRFNEWMIKSVLIIFAARSDLLSMGESPFGCNQTWMIQRWLFRNPVRHMFRTSNRRSLEGSPVKNWWTWPMIWSGSCIQGHWEKGSGSKRETSSGWHTPGSSWVRFRRMLHCWKMKKLKNWRRKLLPLKS